MEWMSAPRTPSVVVIECEGVGTGGDGSSSGAGRGGALSSDGDPLLPAGSAIIGDSSRAGSPSNLPNSNADRVNIIHDNTFGARASPSAVLLRGSPDPLLPPQQRTNANSAHAATDVLLQLVRSASPSSQLRVGAWQSPSSSSEADIQSEKKCGEAKIAVNWSPIPDSCSSSSSSGGSSSVGGGGSSSGSNFGSSNSGGGVRAGGSGIGSVGPHSQLQQEQQQPKGTSPAFKSDAAATRLQQQLEREQPQHGSRDGAGETGGGGGGGRCCRSLAYLPVPDAFIDSTVFAKVCARLFPTTCVSKPRARAVVRFLFSWTGILMLLSAFAVGSTIGVLIATRVLDSLAWGALCVPQCLTLTLITLCYSAPRMLELLRMFELWFVLLNTVGLMVSALSIGIPFPIVVLGAWPAALVFMFFDAAPPAAYLPPLSRVMLGVFTIVTYACMVVFVLSGVVPTTDIIYSFGFGQTSMVDFAVNRSVTLMLFYAKHTASSFIHPDRCVLLADKRPLV